MFCKKGARRNFTKFTGKRLRESLFFNKVAGFRPTTVLKKRLLEFHKIYWKTPVSWSLFK